MEKITQTISSKRSNKRNIEGKCYAVMSRALKVSLPWRCSRTLNTVQSRS